MRRDYGEAAAAAAGGGYVRVDKYHSTSQLAARIHVSHADEAPLHASKCTDTFTARL